MIVNATVNPSKANDMHAQGVPSLGIKPSVMNPNGTVKEATSRPLQVEYDLGDAYYFDGGENEESAEAALRHAISLYTWKGVYANFIKGAKLPIQQKTKAEGDIQVAEDGTTSWKTDADVQSAFDGWKLPDDITNPSAVDVRGSEVFEKMTEAKRRELLMKELAKRLGPEKAAQAIANLGL